MGGGSWTRTSFSDYTARTRGMTLAAYETAKDLDVQKVYRSRGLKESLNAAGKIRECRDSEEHPNTLPVILAIDVTGSMGEAAIKVSQKLNTIITNLYNNESVKDVEFCVMGIGDVKYDEAPIQMSQFESDIRIAEQLDDIYFEGGGGANIYESYSAAWYMGTRHCDLDCWKRGKKGIIITLGDEMPNPHLPNNSTFEIATGDELQDDKDLSTDDVLKEAKEKFDIYHISVDDKDSCYSRNNRYNNIDLAWEKLLGENNYFISTIEKLPQIISNIIINREGGNVVVDFFPETILPTGEESVTPNVEVVIW